MLLRLEAAVQEQGDLPQRVTGFEPRETLRPAWWLKDGGMGGSH